MSSDIVHYFCATQVQLAETDPFRMSENDTITRIQSVVSNQLVSQAVGKRKQVDPKGIVWQPEITAGGCIFLKFLRLTP